MPAKVPERFIKRPETPVPLRDVPVGETVLIAFTDMKVDEEGNCFLDANAEAFKAMDTFSVRVKRAEDGYHVAITVPQLKWTPQKIEGGEWIPAASVVEDCDPLWQMYKKGDKG